MLFHLDLSPHEHFKKYLDKNQCFNKGKLIIPNSLQAEITTLNKQLLAVWGRPPLHLRKTAVGRSPRGTWGWELRGCFTQSAVGSP